MGEYSKFISEKRRAVPTPENIVDEKGNCVFGTFDKEFQKMDFLKIKKPTAAPQGMNKLKLTLWEATEVNLKDGVLLTAVSDMGFMGKILCVFYDKVDKKTYTWDVTTTSGNAVICDNLLDGAKTFSETKDGKLLFVNNYEKDECTVEGSFSGLCNIGDMPQNKVEKGVKGNKIEFSFKYSRISKPCVVSIPFGANRPLYSQKDLFKAEGKLVLNDKVYETDPDAMSIIDDHRGYYPRKAHYDWVTTMGINETDGKKRIFAFNLTANQSTNPEDYNENLIWFDGDTSLLPPVKFESNNKSKDYKDGTVWTVKDEHDMVNVQFTIHGQNSMITHTGVINIDYFITFGEMSGYVRDEDGNKYVLDGMVGIGEDKTLLL